MNFGLAILIAVLWGFFNLLIVDVCRELHREKEDEVSKSVSNVQRYYNPMDEVQTKPLPRKKENIKPLVWDAASLHRYHKHIRERLFAVDAETATAYDRDGNVAYRLKKIKERDDD